MAVTKILPRSGGLQQAIDYVLNGDKTDDCMLVLVGAIKMSDRIIRELMGLG